MVLSSYSVYICRDVEFATHTFVMFFNFLERNSLLDKSAFSIASPILRTDLPLTSRLMYNHNRNRKLDISTEATIAKSLEPAYSQALNQNKIAMHMIKIQRVR